jgi:hypothetical protein
MSFGVNRPRLTPNWGRSRLLQSVPCPWRHELSGHDVNFPSRHYQHPWSVDQDVLKEIELLAAVMTAATERPGQLTQLEIDELLQLAPPVTSQQNRPTVRPAAPHRPRSVSVGSAQDR